MTQFDLIVLALLAISAVVGFARGAVREIAAMLALVVAAVLAVVCLPVSARISHHVVHAMWLAATLGLAAVFAVAYVVLRLIGAGIAQRVQRTHVLGGLDRTAGLAIGLARGLVVLGGLYLMFNAATPEDLRPRWITGSLTWPPARAMGHLLTALAPRGLDLAGRVKPAFERAVNGGSGDRTTTEGYDAPQRGGSDDLVEKSR